MENKYDKIERRGFLPANLSNLLETLDGVLQSFGIAIKVAFPYYLFHLRLAVFDGEVLVIRHFPNFLHDFPYRFSMLIVKFKHIIWHAIKLFSFGSTFCKSVFYDTLCKDGTRNRIDIRQPSFIHLLSILRFYEAVSFLASYFNYKTYFILVVSTHKNRLFRFQKGLKKLVKSVFSGLRLTLEIDMPKTANKFVFLGGLT